MFYFTNIKHINISCSFYVYLNKWGNPQFIPINETVIGVNKKVLCVSKIYLNRFDWQFFELGSNVSWFRRKLSDFLGNYFFSYWHVMKTSKKLQCILLSFHVLILNANYTKCIIYMIISPFQMRFIVLSICNPLFSLRIKWKTITIINNKVCREINCLLFNNSNTFHMEKKKSLIMQTLQIIGGKTYYRSKQVLFHKLVISTWDIHGALRVVL